MTTKHSWSRRFVLRGVLWLIPVSLLWTLITPTYNVFLTTSAENLVRLTEDPNATRLLTHQNPINNTSFHLK